MRPRRRKRGCVAAVLALVALCAFGTIAGLGQAASAGPASPCGPAGASTLLVRESVRVYRTGDPTRRTLVCDRGLEGVALARGVQAPFAITRPWVAGVSLKMEGLDTASVRVAEADLRSRRHSSCRIGAADRPGSLPRVRGLWVGAAGRIAVSADVPLAGGPQLAICAAGDLRVLASGAGFDPASVGVTGETLKWTEDGRRHSFHL